MSLAPQALALIPRVEDALEQIRLSLHADGGDIELLEITSDLRARVRLVGACAGCPAAGLTLRYVVEAKLKELVPELTGIALGVPSDLPFDVDSDPDPR